MAAKSTSSFPLQNLRNIGIIAHIDAGKTSLTEAMLFYSGFAHKIGQVDDGTTTTDYDEEEQERGITIYSVAVPIKWNNCVFNIIDTPGHVDFTAEVERSLRVLDGAVIVFSAREGVEAQSETVWRQAEKYHVPKIAFINKMDREGADFYDTVQEMEKRLECNPLVLTIPVGAGPAHTADPFRAVIDLIKRKMVVYDQSSDGKKFTLESIPDELADDVEMWRAQMMDQLSMFSDELTEALLAEEEPSEELIRKVIRQATINDMCVPVFCGTALHKIGIQMVLDGVDFYLPSPLDKPPVEAEEVGGKKIGQKVLLKPDPKEPLAALLFKIVPDKHGDFCFLRIYSGVLKASSRVLNPGRNVKENIPQIWRILADDREQVPEATAGEIVGVIGLRGSSTGDTICDTHHPVLLESISFPETVISMAIEPETSTDKKKLEETLEMLRRQDPTFTAKIDQETGQTLISGMGELHLEVIKHRILRDFKLNVRVHNPRVSYRETIIDEATVTGECRRIVGGAQLFADVTIKVEPLPAGDQQVLVVPGFDLNAEEPAFPLGFWHATVETLKDQGASGSFGFPLIGVKMTVLGGEAREGESTDVAFRIAASDAFNKALKAAGNQILEPVMKVEITSPDECVGDIVGDLQQRRAVVNGTAVRGKSTVINATAPLINLFGYSNAVRGLSQGRASFSMEPYSYAPAPKDIVNNFM